MRDDEFNNVEIKNSRDNFSSFEFGSTQKNESTSFIDNKNSIKDEVNDNPSSNSPHKDSDQRKQAENELREQLNNSASETSAESSASSNSAASGGAANGSVSSGAAAASGSVAASASSAVSVVGATVVAVATVSTLVGINLYVQGRCQMKTLEATAVAVNYDLELLDTNDDKYIITIENKENNYYSYQDLEEGQNAGEFNDLTPESKYFISVVDSTRDNYSIYDEEIITLKLPEPDPEPEPEPEPEPIAVTYEVKFYVDDEVIDTQTIEENGTVTRPEVDPEKVGCEFRGWCISENEDWVEYDFSTNVTKSFDIYAVFDPLTPGIYSITWDKTLYVGENYELEYSLDYYQETEGQLRNLKLTLSTPDADRPMTREFELTIGEETQTVSIEINPDFDLLNNTFNYSFTYDKDEQTDIILEEGEVTFTSNNPELNSFEITGIESLASGFKAHYKYNLTDSKNKLSDADFSIRLDCFNEAAQTESMVLPIEIDPDSNEGTFESEDSTLVSEDGFIYDYTITANTSDVTGEGDVLYTGSFAPYMKQNEAFIAMNIGGLDNFYYDYGDNTYVYVPIELLFNYPETDFDDAFQFGYGYSQDSAVESGKFSPDLIYLQDENYIDMCGTRFIRIDRECIDSNANINFTEVSITYLDGSTILYSKDYTQTPDGVLTLSPYEDEWFCAFGGMVDSLTIDHNAQLPDQTAISLSIAHNDVTLTSDDKMTVEITPLDSTNNGAICTFKFEIDPEFLMGDEPISVYLNTCDSDTEGRDSTISSDIDTVIYYLTHYANNITLVWDNGDRFEYPISKNITFYLSTN